MKTLKFILLEKLKLNNNKIEDIKYDQSNYQEALEILKEEANSKNYTIRFRNHPNGNTGDFTIFIYKNGEKKYKVGFDGSWNSKYEEYNFQHCYQEALQWLEKQ